MNNKLNKIANQANDYNEQEHLFNSTITEYNIKNVQKQFEVY